MGASVTFLMPTTAAISCLMPTWVRQQCFQESPSVEEATDAVDKDNSDVTSSNKRRTSTKGLAFEDQRPDATREAHDVVMLV